MPLSNEVCNRNFIHGSKRKRMKSCLFVNKLLAPVWGYAIVLRAFTPMPLDFPFFAPHPSTSFTWKTCVVLCCQELKLLNEKYTLEMKFADLRMVCLFPCKINFSFPFVTSVISLNRWIWTLFCKIVILKTFFSYIIGSRWEAKWNPNFCLWRTGSQKRLSGKQSKFGSWVEGEP